VDVLIHAGVVLPLVYQTAAVVVPTKNRSSKNDNMMRISDLSVDITLIFANIEQIIRKL
jgi:hypothetical protein